MRSKELISKLENQTQEHIEVVKTFLKLPDSTLNFKPTAEQWSILECIEHLNRYGNFYIPEIRQKILQSNTTSVTEFSSSWLGSYFSNSMLPKEKLNKMKTFPSMNPLNSQLNREVLHTFLYQQQAIMDLLQEAQSVNLIKTKTAISISRWIKLRLGDTFQVIIYHNLRHIVQAKKVLSASNVSTRNKITP